MSNINDKSAGVSPLSQPHEQYFPPPPPGPPPAQAPAAQHPNETPIKDYNPTNPNHPNSEADDIYDATPTDEHPPQFPPRPAQQQQEGKASKPGWGSKLSGWGSKAAGPLNALANKMGSEAFFPGPLDKECEKAARILKSFCSKLILQSNQFKPTHSRTKILTKSFHRGRHLQRRTPPNRPNPDHPPRTLRR